MKIRKPLHFLFAVFFVLVLLSNCKQKTDYYSRGVGIYPGNPKEDFSPSLVTDNKEYRNIARLRPAYHSSSYDYNLTAQLVTDGIVINEMSDYISVSTNNGVLPKNEREWLFDNNSLTEVNLSGTDIWIQLELNSGKVPEISKININGSLEFSGKPNGSDSIAPKPSFSFRFGIPKTQRLINQSFEFKEPVAYHFQLH